MQLPDVDQTFLSERSLVPTISVESSMLCVVFPQWRLPPGYALSEADLLLRLPAGYPDVPPDMWWFSPAIVLASGARPPATESMESYLGRVWQRWSRHFNGGQWKSGIDGLESFLALIRRELERSAGTIAA
jgi:Prokaryotic E2 family E